jgi:hypothetical protein
VSDNFQTKEGTKSLEWISIGTRCNKSFGQLVTTGASSASRDLIEYTRVIGSIELAPWKHKLPARTVRKLTEVLAVAGFATGHEFEGVLLLRE